MERDKLLGSMDAKVWTDEFMATKARLGNKEFDHAMMLAWFANAIMAGFDEANRRAQRALDAEREKVKELVANQAEYEKCTDEQITALNQGCLDYEKQIATLQAQLAALRHDYAQLKEAYDAKESGVPLGPVVGAQTIVNQQREINRLQAQLRHMTKERDIQKEVADNQAWHVRDLKAQLRQVEGENQRLKEACKLVNDYNCMHNHGKKATKACDDIFEQLDRLAREGVK